MKPSQLRLIKKELIQLGINAYVGFSRTVNGQISIAVRSEQKIPNKILNSIKENITLPFDYKIIGS